MTLADLHRTLHRLNVPPGLYRLDGTPSEGAHVFARDGATWVVFLSERGGRSSPVTFDSESDACTFLLGRVCEDLAARHALRVVPALVERFLAAVTPYAATAIRAAAAAREPRRQVVRLGAFELSLGLDDGIATIVNTEDREQRSTRPTADLLTLIADLPHEPPHAPLTPAAVLELAIAQLHALSPDLGAPAWVVPDEDLAYGVESGDITVPCGALRPPDDAAVWAPVLAVARSWIHVNALRDAEGTVVLSIRGGPVLTNPAAVPPINVSATRRTFRIEDRPEGRPR